VTARPRISSAIAALLGVTLCAAGNGVSRADDVAPNLGQFSIQVMNEGVHGAVRPAGSVELLLTCTSPVAFAHRIHTSPDGNLHASAPLGTCGLESVSAVRVGAKWYRWRLNVDIHPGINAFKLSSRNALVEEGEDAPPESLPADSPSTASAEVVEPVDPTDEISLPERLVTVSAEYPIEARKNRIQGKVILQAVVGTDGRVSQASIFSSSDPIFNDPAMEALSQYLFRPARRGGQPVAIYYTVRTDFQLR
jgi:TonB family protein